MPAAPCCCASMVIRHGPALFPLQIGCRKPCGGPCMHRPVDWIDPFPTPRRNHDPATTPLSDDPARDGPGGCGGCRAHRHAGRSHHHDAPVAHPAARRQGPAHRDLRRRLGRTDRCALSARADPQLRRGTARTQCHLLVRPHEQQVADRHREHRFREPRHAAPRQQVRLQAAADRSHRLRARQEAGAHRPWPDRVRLPDPVWRHPQRLRSLVWQRPEGHRLHAQALSQRLHPQPGDAGAQEQGQELQGWYPGHDPAPATAPLPALALRARLPDRLAHQEAQDPRQDPDPGSQAQDRAHRRGLQAGLRRAVRGHHHPRTQRARAGGGSLQQAHQDRGR